MSDTTELETLDRLMAEKVRGWHADSLEQTWRLSGGEPRYPMQRWQPTIYIEQAMECYAEAKQRHGFFMRLNDYGSKGWYCQLVKQGDDYVWGIAVGKSEKTLAVEIAKEPAEAICLALKEVVG